MLSIIKDDPNRERKHEIGLAEQKIVREFVEGGYKNRNSKVFEVIDNALLLNCSDYFFIIVKKGTALYRAREVEINEIKTENGFSVDENGTIHGFNEDESMEPPLGLSRSGRNNIPGESYLYVSEDEETALGEIKVPVKTIVSLAEIELLEDLRVYDFSYQLYTSKGNELNTGDIFTAIVDLFNKRVSKPDEYIATQVIADYVRKKRFDGLSYKSYYTGKRNYTIFNCHPSYFRFLGSRILFSQGGPQYFWDESNRKAVVSDYSGMNYESSNSDGLVEMVKNKINVG